MIYEEYTTNQGNLFIKRINDDETTSFIPLDPANSDYQAYLKSLEAEQSTPSIPEGEN
jgi:hypothetical protein